VLAAELVTADGDILHVDASSYPDLFWAIRGGGGNFGVVTRFCYQLHAVADRRRHAAPAGYARGHRW
jgi:FAD/FMN-containing dehydrogenase